MGGAATRRARISNPRVVLIGDAGSGKTSLIISVASDSFQAKAVPVLPPTCLPANFYGDGIPLTIIDTSSRLEDRSKLEMECKTADAIVLTYACNKALTLARVSSYWLPELRRIGVKVPVIVVGCKLDLRTDEQPNLEKTMAPIMRKYKEIETCIECSALRQVQVAEVFYYSQKAVVHPTAPIFDQETQTLRPLCVRALKRIFINCDHDRDGALSDAELNEFQVKCFGAPLQPSEVVGVKKVVADKLPEGVNENGLTFTGFLFLNALFVERGRMETAWTVLRSFGYDDKIRLRDDLLQNPSFKRSPDQTVELTDKVVDFLREVFTAFDVDGDGALRSQELEDVYSTAPSSPWDDVEYKDAMEKNPMGGVTINGFLSQWALMTLLDPVRSLEHLIYLGFSGEPASAFRITRRRCLDHRKQRSQRSVFQCFAFGPSKSGKTALLNALIGRPYVEDYTHTNEVRYSVNVIDCTLGSKKTLVLREIPQDAVQSLLDKKEALASCDVAAIFYDSSDESSWKQAITILLEVSAHGNSSGHKVPCILIAAKDDLGPHSAVIAESTRVCQDMNVEAPISISMKLGDIGNVFHRIVDAAQRPHLNIPITAAGKNCQQYHEVVNHCLVYLSVGAAVVAVGIAAYRVYIMSCHHQGSG